MILLPSLGIAIFAVGMFYIGFKFGNKTGQKTGWDRGWFDCQADHAKKG